MEYGLDCLIIGHDLIYNDFRAVKPTYEISKSSKSLKIDSIVITCMKNIHFRVIGYETLIHCYSAGN